LMVEWFIFKFVVDSHHIPPIESTVRMINSLVNRTLKRKY
jgi:hypothetical protein